MISANEVLRSLGWTLAALAPLAALALALGFALSPDAVAEGAPWSSLGLAAPHCPGCWLCGMSHAFAALGHGRFAQAAQHNPLAFAAWPLAWLVALGGGFFLVRNLIARRLPLSVSSLTLLALSAFFTLVALIPCVGWLNFVAVPLCLVTVVVGIVGLASDRDPASGQPRGRNAHLLAVICGLMLASVAFVRWVLGGFVI